MADRRRTAIAVVVLASGASWLTGPDLRSAQTARPEPPAGVIFGRVVDGGTARAVAGAVVRLSVGATAGVPAAAGSAPVGPPGPPRSGPVPNAITDAAGRFLFRGVAPGTYTLAVQAPGYLPASYGQRRPDGLARAVRLEAGAHRTDLLIEAWRAGAIEGTLRDELGDPVVGAAVRALRRNPATASAELVATAIANTDDRGIYRLAPLPPGEYVVLAPSNTTSLPESSVAQLVDALSRIATSGSNEDAPPIVLNMAASGALISPEGIRVGDAIVQVPLMQRQASAVAPAPTPDGALDVYRTTFYPAATSVTGASIVELGSGEVRSGIDIALDLTRAFRVSGTLELPDGPPGDLVVRLLPSDSRAIGTDFGFETAMTVSRPDGSFTLLGVPAGEYRMVVLRFGRPAATTEGALAAFNQETLWADEPVSVVDREVTGLVVPLRLGLHVEGRVVFEGTAPPPATARRTAIGLLPVEGRAFGNVAGPQPLDANSAFQTVPYPPGRYFFTVRPPGPEWVVKAISSGGQPITDEPIALDARDIREVVVTLTNRIATLSGVVRGAPTAPDAVVLLMPGDVERWIANGLTPALLRATVADVDGSFRIGGLAAGEYLVVAADAGADLDTRDEDTIRALARLGSAVTIAEGVDRTVALTIAQVPR